MLVMAPAQVPLRCTRLRPDLRTGRRRLGLLTFALTLGLIALLPVSIAHGVTNTYDVSASTSPTTAGSKARPVPIGIRFAYSVGEVDGLRPAPVLRYRIVLRGVDVNHRGFERCTASRINQDQSDRRCSSRALLGKGSVENVIGGSATPADRSLACHLDLRIYNSGSGRAALFLKGSPGARRPCITDIALAIAAKFVPVRGGIALQFDVPQSLRHPVASLDNAVVRVEASLRKLTRKSGKKRIGFFESRGGCSKGERRVSVVFTDEAGKATTERTNARCR
jgi:hypothetical protein